MKLTVAVVRLLTSVLAFVVSFFPPTGLPGGDANDVYDGLLVVCFLVVLAIPIIIYALHDKCAKATNLTLTSLTR